MRGKPIMQWLLFTVAWCLLLIPILYVTRASPDRAETVPDDIHEELVWVSLRFSTTPTGFALLQNEELRWEELNPDERRFEKAIPLSMDSFGADLRIRATLPSGESVIEVVVQPDAKSPRVRTLWVTGNADEVLTFSWGRDE